MDTTTTPQAPAPKPAHEIITELRSRVNAGHTLDRDEVRQALGALRQNRLSAAASEPKAKKSAAPTRSATELLASLKASTVKPEGSSSSST